MVKKSSLMSRLKDRFRTSGVQVEAEPVRRRSNSLSSQRSAGAPRVNPRPTEVPKASRVEPDEVEELQAESRLAKVEPEKRSTRKMSSKEEAALAMGEGFGELATLLRGLQTRMDSSGSQMAEVAESLRALPSVSQAQLEMLRGVASQLERSNQLGESIAQNLGTLPGVMKDVQKALDRAAATDERTAGTLNQFQDTMGRIHDSMSKMADREGSDAIKNMVESSTQRQEDSVRELQRTTDESVASLRRSQEDQSNRLRKVVEDNGKWNQALIVMLGLVVVGLGAVLAVVLAG